MSEDRLDRRTLLAATSALGAAAMMPRLAQAQQAAPAATASGLPPRGDFVVRGAYILSMDESVGEFPTGDVHVSDGIIAGLGVSVNASDAEVIDGKGMICMPGFVDTHWHHWTTLLRPVMRADDPKKTYFPVTFGLGLHYEPEDSYRSVRLSLAQAIAAGITTTHNWAHNVRSPAHADAEVKAMRESGVRGRFAYGTPLGLANDKPMDLADLGRLKQALAKDPLIGLGICSRNLDGNTGGTRGAIGPEMAKKEWGAAREMGLPITLHTSGTGAIQVMKDAGLLGPDLQLVHPLNTSAADREALAAHKVHYSTSPIGEAGRAGEMQFIEMLQAGILVSNSIDNVTAERCDCFACMRMLQTINKHRTGGKFALTTERLVQIATIEGARDLGLAHDTGSLTPGKRADLILVRTDAPNMAPVENPYDALVQLAEPANIEMTVVDGRILYRGGRFTGLDYGKLLDEAAQSLAALKQRAKWS